MEDVSTVETESWSGLDSCIATNSLVGSTTFPSHLASCARHMSIVQDMSTTQRGAAHSTRDSRVLYARYGPASSSHSSTFFFPVQHGCLLVRPRLLPFRPANNQNRAILRIHVARDRRRNRNTVQSRRRLATAALTRHGPATQFLCLFANPIMLHFASSSGTSHGRIMSFECRSTLAMICLSSACG